MGLIQIKVIPNASKKQIIKDNETIKIKLVSPAKGGKANKELKEFLSKKLRVSKSKINIISGEYSSYKKIEVKGLTQEEILKRLI